jgi:hypothetical protein
VAWAAQISSFKDEAENAPARAATVIAPLEHRK